MSDKTKLEKPEVCSIQKETTSESEEFKPEVCSIDTHEKEPQVCSINKEAKAPEVCSFDTHEKAPEVCSIDTHEKAPQVCSINREDKAPEVCSIDTHEKAPEVCSINREDDAPEVCSINQSPNETEEFFKNTASSPKRHPKSPDILNIRMDKDNLEHENIADTYGFNVPVTPEERQAILKTLEEAEKSSDTINLTDDIYITVVKNGPYILHGKIPILDGAIKTDAQGQSIGWDHIKDLVDKNEVALCRCGRSKNPPFCDESHLKFDFDGTCTASNEPYNQAAAIYRGCNGIYLMDEESLCAIVRFCDPDGSCWNLIKSEETDEIAIEESFNCCSGRLTVIKDGKKCEPKLKKEIECVYDTERDVLGPLWVKGRIPVKTEDTDYEVRNRVTLCRCGRSYNKPFCDGMHLTCPKLTEKEIQENE